MLRQHKVELRYRPTPQITSGMRVVDAGRYLYIRSVADVEERHIEWQIKAYELLLDLSADIQRNLSSTMNLGQPTNDWQSILSNGPVPCAMTQPSHAVAQQYAELIGVQQTSVFSFNDGQDVKPDDHLVAGSTIWTVHALLAPQSYLYAVQVLAGRIS